MRHVDDTERRSRLAVRHGIHPAHRLADPVGATRAMTVLHATEAASVHLAVHARVAGVSAADVERALNVDRTIVKQLAMRRTLFVFPRDLLPAALGSASARVAAGQRRLIIRDVEQHGLARDGGAWLEAASRAVLARLGASGPLTARQLRDDLPELAGTVTRNAGKRYGGTIQIAPRVLTLLGAEGRVVRGPNSGHWRISRPTWALMDQWLGEEPEPLPEEEGYAELVRRWLWTFGPGTLDDVQWWLGSTRTSARKALTAVGAAEVRLDDGTTGWVLPDDDEPVPPPEPRAALLPALDPTTMGWKGRGFFLPPQHVPHLFDSNGNAGTTAWWDGRIVGCWVQDAGGAVHVVLAEGEDVGVAGRAALHAEADRLTAWLDGVRITNGYASLMMRSAVLP